MTQETQPPFVGVIRYRDQHGNRVAAHWRDDDTVRLRIRPGSEEEVRKTMTREEMEDAVALGVFRSSEEH